MRGVVADEDALGFDSARLRDPGRCQDCREPAPAGVTAWRDRLSKEIVCQSCWLNHVDPLESADVEPRPVTPAPPAVVDTGVGGRSARVEYERGRVRDAERPEARWGTERVGRIAKFMADEPRSTGAWLKGADGEWRLAQRLNRDLAGEAAVLHDRSRPGSRADIDHLVVAASGVWTIDAKNYHVESNVATWAGGDESTTACTSMVVIAPASPPDSTSKRPPSRRRSRPALSTTFRCERCCASRTRTGSGSPGRSRFAECWSPGPPS